MAVAALRADEVGAPDFAVTPAASSDVFALSSHERAREAIQFGLSIRDPGFNIFVLGEDRSGRMTATLGFLRRHVAGGTPPPDWVYLNNFAHPSQPRPYRLPAGRGRVFRDRMQTLVDDLRESLVRAFSDEAYQREAQAVSEAMQGEVGAAMDALRAEARQSGLDILQSPQGPAIVAIGPDGQPLGPEALPEEARAGLEQAAAGIGEKLRELNLSAARRRLELAGRLRELNRRVADAAIGGLFDALATEMAGLDGITRWLIEMRNDVLDHFMAFRESTEEEGSRTADDWLERRYAVNLLVDQIECCGPSVVLEPNPTYENLFGWIEYRAAEGGMETDYSMIRAGALHRANGGILVLRAEALAANPMVWFFLKGALRDRAIRLEELHRAGAVPIAGAPKPEEIPLDLKVVVVGAPHWYYTFFSADPEYQTHFKIKADIDADMDATPRNLASYAGLIAAFAAKLDGASCDAAAIGRLLAYASRRAADRKKLSSRFEMIEDVVVEAARIAGGGRNVTIGAAHIEEALTRRRRRNARVEDRMQEHIARGTVMIDTTGETVGQVNALVVRDLGDHAFGAPSRVTARASIGRHGVINIERDVDLGGPIQQKGVMVLQGLLAGRFARRFPLSFDCSITFEQSYGGVEGDSASIAELVAILSDLAGVAVRQSVAVTGSLNQHGQVQAIGGAHYKIEGFFRTCQEAGGLTGDQGVVIPAANRDDIVLLDPVVEAVRDGRFHVWAVDSIEDAIERMMILPPGTADADGRFPPDTVFGCVQAQLERFDAALKERHGAV